MNSARVPLAEQLDELAAEYVRRCRAYPLLVARGQLRQTAAELKIERLAAAHNTLAWLHKHADQIKDWVAYTSKVTPAEHLPDVMTGLAPDLDPGEPEMADEAEPVGDFA